MAEHSPAARPRGRRRLNSPDSRLSLHSFTRGPGVVVVTATGEIDLANRAALAEALTSASSDPDLRLLVCDLAKVTFLACTGVSTLVELQSELDARGAPLRVVASDPVVLRVLDATDQRENLGVRPNLASALRGFVDAPPAPTIAHLRVALDEAVEQTTTLADMCGRLAEQLTDVDADLIFDERGGRWKPDDTLADMAEDLRVLRRHLATGALLAAPAVEDLGHLHET